MVRVVSLREMFLIKCHESTTFRLEVKIVVDDPDSPETDTRRVEIPPDFIADNMSTNETDCSRSARFARAKRVMIVGTD